MEEMKTEQNRDHEPAVLRSLAESQTEATRRRKAFVNSMHSEPLERLFV